MSDELGEMIREILRIASKVVMGKIKLETAQHRTDKVIKKIEDWHKSERKKWAMGLLLWAEKRINKKWAKIYGPYKNGGKDILNAIRKKIEEG